MSAHSTTIAVLIAFTMIVPAGVFLALNDNSQASPGSTILRMGFDRPIDSLNPYMGLTEAAQVFYSLVYDSLQGVGGDLNPVPCLASEWRIVPGELPHGSVWEYNVSPGAEWSDSFPVTAEDIAWNINMNSNPLYYDAMWAYQPYSYFMEYAQVVDSDTVRIHFWNRFDGSPIPVAYGDNILTPMLPKHLLESMDPFEIAFMWTGYPVVGSGPFVTSPAFLNDWMNGDVVTLLRNPDYYGGPNYGRYVQFDKIEMRFYDNPAAISLALENNELDVAQLSFEEFFSLKSRIDSGQVLNVEAYDGPRPDGYWEQVLINQNDAGPNPSRLDPDIRHAMAMATDKSSILSQFYLGEGMLGSTLISPVSDWHYDLGAGEEFVYDLTAANALLNASGYLDIDSDGIRECTSSSWAYQQGYVILNRHLEYQMYTRMEHPEESDIAQFLEAEWAKIGIDVQSYVVDESTLASIVYAYNYDTAIWSWDMDPDPNYILFSQSKRSWNAWSDTKYYSPAYEENHTASVMATDSLVRHSYVDNCQRIHYQDTPYIIFAYLNHTYAWRTDTFSGWGDWDSYPGRSITASWSGNPLYFELVPLVEHNSDPSDVSIVADPAFASPGALIAFTARASDADGDNLSFYIDFGDGSSDQTVSTGPMYSMHEVAFSHAYSYEDTFIVTVWVDDGSGLPGGNVSASVTVSVSETGPRSVDYRWYDIFNVPTGEWWDTRWVVYSLDEPITDAYPFLFRYSGPIADNNVYLTSMRLDISGQNMPEVNMNSWPEFLPLFGTERGGNASIDWYMQYLTAADAARYPQPVQNLMDGWINVLNGTTTLDRQASKAVMDLTDANFDDFAGWWVNNSDGFTSDYSAWLSSEGNDRLDIYNMYEWPLTIFYFTIDAAKVGETVVLTYDIVTWGMECLMARWLHEASLPTESFYEDFSLKAMIGPEATDLNISTAVEYAAYAWETTLVPGGESTGQPCWIWEGELGDYAPSQPAHPGSAFDPYDGSELLCKSPGSILWHSYVPYDYTPTAWNLSAGEILSFEWPSGDQLFFVHDELLPLNPINVTGPMSVRYSEPMEMDFAGQIVNDQGARTIVFTGPMDMWTWSRDQVRHEYLASEWDRLGVLPYGMPWIEFQLDSGLNTPPTALFEFDPELGDITTNYAFAATDSWDLEDAADSLEVRWDWEGDGTYDTGWSTTKVANHQFATAGTYDVTVEVRDSQGLTDTKVLQVVVTEVIPEIPVTMLPIIAVVLILVVSRSRRRR